MNPSQARLAFRDRRAVRALLLCGLLASACQLHVGAPATLSAPERLARAEHAARGCDAIAANHLLRAVSADSLGTIPALQATLARFQSPFDDPTRCPASAPSLLPNLGAREEVQSLLKKNP